MSFRVHVQTKLKFENAAQLAAYYNWMNTILTNSYYTAEKDYVTPDEEFKTPLSENVDCVICRKQ